MNFVSLLQSIEGGIYEIVAWAMLFPKTIIAALFKPSWMTKYVNDEWENKKEDDRFDEFLSPGLLWILVSVFQIFFSDPIASWTSFLEGVPGLETIFRSFQALEGETRLAVQVAILLQYPFFYLIWMEKLNDTPIQKSTLNRLFQKHCYALAPAQLLGTLASAILPGLSILFIWLYEIFLFRSEFKFGWRKSIWHAIVPLLLLGLFIIGAVFAAFFLGAFTS